MQTSSILAMNENQKHRCKIHGKSMYSHIHISMYFIIEMVNHIIFIINGCQKLWLLLFLSNRFDWKVLYLNGILFHIEHIYVSCTIMGILRVCVCAWVFVLMKIALTSIECQLYHLQQKQIQIYAHTHGICVKNNIIIMPWLNTRDAMCNYSLVSNRGQATVDHNENKQWWNNYWLNNLQSNDRLVSNWLFDMERSSVKFYRHVLVFGLKRTQI